MRQRDHRIPAPEEARPLLPRIAWATVVCWIVAVPLIVSPHGKDAFRVPKDLLFLAAGIVVMAITAAMAIDFRVRPAFEAIRRHPVALIAAGIVIWTCVTTLTSTNRALSEAALLWVVAAAALAIAIVAFARSKTIAVLYWALLPAAINAIIFLLQRFRIWSPIRFDPTTPPHLLFTALLGNPDDVGSFLVAPMIVTLALIIADARWRKVSVPVALLLGAALLTGQITSIVATVAGALVLGVIRSRRSGIVTIVALAILIPLFAFAYPPLRTRVVEIRTAMAAGDYATAFSGRVTPFSAALLMWRDHPIFGVGPDCFPWQYFPYKLEAERRNPRLVAAYAHTFNFGEVHNDHLQALAETGIPGYALFLSAFWILGRWSRKTIAASDDSPERRLSRIACVPLAVSLFVLCLAHFPLHLASATAMYLFIGMLCFGWSVPLVVPMERRSSSFALARFAGSALVLVAGAYSVYKLACHPYACNIRKREIENITANTLNEADSMRAARRARRTLEMLSACEEDLRNDVDFYMLSAANDRILGAQADAEAMYAKGLLLDRRPELYYGLGSVQLEQGKTAQAVASFVNAVTFNRELMNQVPSAIRPQVLAIVQRNFPYLGLSQ